MISLGVYDIPGDIRNYLTYKNVYADYRKNRNKDKFYEEHRAELFLYDTALRTLKEKASGNKLPSMIALLSLAASSQFLATKKPGTLTSRLGNLTHHFLQIESFLLFCLSFDLSNANFPYAQILPK